MLKEHFKATLYIQSKWSFMSAVALQSLHKKVAVAGQRLENLHAHLQTKSWLTHESEGDHLVRGENELKQEITKAMSELRVLRSDLRTLEILTDANQPV